MNISQDFIPKNRGNRPGKVNPMQYITIHNTGNSSKGANAKAHSNYLKSDGGVNAQVCWHYTVDDKEIYQHLPDNENAWHCGDGKGDGNSKSIGIEICMNSDGDLLKATNNAVELVVYLCKAHNIPISNVVQHNKWSGKNCPQMLRSGNPYDWNTFIAKVKQGLEAQLELTSVNDLVWELAYRGIISDKDLWLKKLTEDENAYWLARKTVKYLINKNI